MAHPNEWQAVTSDNAATVEHAISNLRLVLDAQQYGDFWTDVKDVSRLFKDLTPLARLTCPVCIIAWDGDPLHPFELAKRMAAVLPNARLSEMPGLPAVFADPASIGRRYQQYLRGNA